MLLAPNRREALLRAATRFRASAAHGSQLLSLCPNSDAPERSPNTPKLAIRFSQSALSLRSAAHTPVSVASRMRRSAWRERAWRKTKLNFRRCSRNAPVRSALSVTRRSGSRIGTDGHSLLLIVTSSSSVGRWLVRRNARFVLGLSLIVQAPVNVPVPVPVPERGNGRGGWPIGWDGSGSRAFGCLPPRVRFSGSRQ